MTMTTKRFMHSARSHRLDVITTRLDLIHAQSRLDLIHVYIKGIKLFRNPKNVHAKYKTPVSGKGFDLITINVPLFKKLRDIIFFCGTITL